MLLDNNLFYSDAQSLVGSTGDIASTNTLDIVKGGDAAQFASFLVVAMKAAATSGGSATVQARLETADDSAFSTNKKVLWMSAAIPVASLTAGYRFMAGRLPIGMREFSRVVFNVGTAALTAGTANAFLAPSVDQAALN